MRFDHRLTNWMLEAWYGSACWLHMLRPLSSVYRTLAEKNRHRYLNGEKPSWRAPVPVIVVGNITVGGAGKTPLVIAITQFFKAQGLRPGIVSRGYGGQSETYPLVVTADSQPAQVGDEPLLIACRTDCPVVVDPNRVEAVKKLIADFECDLVISDDGLQHYALGRDIEICVIDGKRGLGNRCLLPEGPLRESHARLSELDFVVVNGESEQKFRLDQNVMSLQPAELQLVSAYKYQHNSACGDVNTTGSNSVKNKKPGEKINAVAGIGHPERFFQSLEAMGYDVIKRPFPDHYQFTSVDFAFKEMYPIVMTEKDAIKCQQLKLSDAWILPVEARVDDAFWQQLLAKYQVLISYK